jgi:hypothetical protein
MMFTDTEKLECARREVKQREHVYPRRVEAGQMSQALADRQIALMKSIADDYEKLAEKERLL